MSAVTIRNLKDETHRALKARARKAGRSTEAEIRAILEEAVKPPKGQVGLGTALKELGQKYGGIELDITRDKSPARVAKFD
jgi:plasmid stability protein